MKKGSKPKRSKQGSLLTQRNQVRGLIAAAKSTEVVLSKSKSGKDKSAQAQQFQRSLAALLVRTREGMGASHYGDFLGWLERQTSTQLGALRDLRALDSVLLREVLEASPVSYTHLECSVRQRPLRMAHRTPAARRVEVHSETSPVDWRLRREEAACLPDCGALVWRRRGARQRRK